MAYYLNKQARQVYITLICVETQYQNYGIGSKLLGKLVVSVTHLQDAYDSIALEVNKLNSKAYSFYKKHGFVEQEDRGTKFLMKKNL